MLLFQKLFAIAPLLPVLMEDDDGFSITNMLAGAVNFLQEIGGYVVLLAGVILLIVGIVQIAKGLAGGGKGQTNWVMSIACLVVGGGLMFGGWALVTSLAKSGGGAIQEMNDAGNGKGAELYKDGIAEGF